MAERSTWPETHLNAVNKLLCLDCSFLGMATRSAATSHIPTSCAVHLAVRREWQVGRKAAVSDTAVEKKAWLSTIPPPHSSLSASPSVTPTSRCNFKTLINPLAYQEALRAQMCDTGADVPVIGGQKDKWKSEFPLQRGYKDKEISDKTEKCTHIDCCHLGAC